MASVLLAVIGCCKSWIITGGLGGLAGCGGIGCIEVISGYISSIVQEIIG